MPSRWTGVMIHHSAGTDTSRADIQAIRRHHVEVNGWADVGYHFVCELVGSRYEVIAGRPLTQDGAHCPGRNKDTIGFCLVGNFTAAAPPTAQWALAARHVAGLCAVLGIGADKVLAHRDHRATECPGKRFDLKRFRELVWSYL
jgi:N-acetylmuramoyl-L-alanine amidase